MQDCKVVNGRVLCNVAGCGASYNAVGASTIAKGRANLKQHIRKEHTKTAKVAHKKQLNNYFHSRDLEHNCRNWMSVL